MKPKAKRDKSLWKESTRRTDLKKLKKTRRAWSCAIGLLLTMASFGIEKSGRFRLALPCHSTPLGTLTRTRSLSSFLHCLLSAAPLLLPLPPLRCTHRKVRLRLRLVTAEAAAMASLRRVLSSGGSSYMASGSVSSSTGATERAGR